MAKEKENRFESELRLKRLINLDLAPAGKCRRASLLHSIRVSRPHLAEERAGKGLDAAWRGETHVPARALHVASATRMW